MSHEWPCPAGWHWKGPPGLSGEVGVLVASTLMRICLPVTQHHGPAHRLHALPRNFRETNWRTPKSLGPVLHLLPRPGCVSLGRGLTPRSPTFPTCKAEIGTPTKVVLSFTGLERGSGEVPGCREEQITNCSVQWLGAVTPELQRTLGRPVASISHHSLTMFLFLFTLWLPW